jgi:hypothetical protein
LDIETPGDAAELFLELRFVRELPLQATNLHRNCAIGAYSQLFTHLLKRHPASVSREPDRHGLYIITTTSSEL